VSLSKHTGQQALRVKRWLQKILEIAATASATATATTTTTTATATALSRDSFKDDLDIFWLVLRILPLLTYLSLAFSHSDTHTDKASETERKKSFQGPKVTTVFACEKPGSEII